MTVIEKLFRIFSINAELVDYNGHGVPILVLGNCGIAKTAVAEMWAKKSGYAFVNMFASSRTADDICGFISLPSDRKEGSSIRPVYIKPDWFVELEDNHAKGIRSVLFIDEINTVPLDVRKVLFSTVQDRRARSLYLPEDTVIIACANYYGTVPDCDIEAPMLNRFAIINVEATIDFLRLSDLKYSNVLKTGELLSYDEVNSQCYPEAIKLVSKLGKSVEEIAKERGITTAKVEEEERKIRKEAFVLMKCVNQSLNDVIEDLVNQNIHSLTESRIANLFIDCPVKDKVYNFYSPRSRDFCVELAGSFYRCFGKESLSSELFKDVICGTVGIAVGTDTDINEPKFTDVADRFEAAIESAIEEFTKLISDSLSTCIENYNEFKTNWTKNREIEITYSTVEELKYLKALIEEFDSFEDTKMPLPEVEIRFILDSIIQTTSTHYVEKVNFILSQISNSQFDLENNEVKEIVSIVRNELQSLINSVNMLVNNENLQYSKEFALEVRKYNEERVIQPLNNRLFLLRRQYSGYLASKGIVNVTDIFAND